MENNSDHERVIAKTPEEMIAAWDQGHFVLSVQMGGLSDGYDWAIQTAAMEMLRALSDGKTKADIKTRSKREPVPEYMLKRMDNAVTAAAGRDELSCLHGISGAQVTAAKHVAVMIAYSGCESIKQAPEDRQMYFRKEDSQILLRDGSDKRRADQGMPKTEPVRIPEGPKLKHPRLEGGRMHHEDVTDFAKAIFSSMNFFGGFDRIQVLEEAHANAILDGYMKSGIARDEAIRRVRFDLEKFKQRILEEMERRYG